MIQNFFRIAVAVLFTVLSLGFYFLAGVFVVAGAMTGEFNTICSAVGLGIVFVMFGIVFGIVAWLSWNKY